MNFHRIGLKSGVQAPGLSGDWFQVGHANVASIKLLGGQTVVVRRKDESKAFPAIGIPIENLAYFIPADPGIFDEQAITMPPEPVSLPPLSEYVGEKRGPGRPKKQPTAPESAE